MRRSMLPLHGFTPVFSAVRMYHLLHLQMDRIIAALEKKYAAIDKTTVLPEEEVRFSLRALSSCAAAAATSAAAAPAACPTFYALVMINPQQTRVSERMPQRITGPALD